MDAPVCLITGANSGIGKATAIGMARTGATVVMVCRNAERANTAREDIVRKTGNKDIHIRLADLASQKSIRELSTDVNTSFPGLNVLVNNAALLLGKRTLTEDNIETTFAVNHLAYFLLSQLLEETLRKNAPARIVNVSSNAHLSGSLDFGNLNLDQGYSSIKAYSQSKLANILFTYEHARRLEGSGVTTNALHPGVVSTRIGSHGFSLFGLIFNLFRPFFLSPDKGAETSLFLASDPSVATTSGKYFVKKKPTQSSPITYDEAVASQLWSVSEALTGLAN